MDIPYPFEGSYIFFSFLFVAFFILVLLGTLRISFHRIASEIATILTPPRRRLILELVDFFWEHHRAKHVLYDSV